MDEERTAALSHWVARELARLRFVERALLFGSRARADNLERSDFDLAIEAPAASEEEWADLVELIESAPTLLRFDIVRLEGAPQALRDEISREGKEIYGRESRAA